MRFLYVAISYPEITKTINMYNSFMQELVNLGHEVRVIAPTYDSDTEVKNEGNIQVLRVKTGPLFNTNLIVKGINTFLLNLRYKRAMFKYWSSWRMDWIITSTPPITLSTFLEEIKNRFQAPLYLMLRDIFPQNAKDLGMIKDPFIFNYFRRKERHLYLISDIIGCMSPGNIEFIKKQDPQLFLGDRLYYFPNWIRPTPLKNQIEAKNSFRERYNLKGKFVALFGGNFGKPQKIEFILELAQKVIHMENVVFCLVGDGAEKNRILKMKAANGINNVIILNRIPHVKYQSMIQDADLGLVNLSDKFTIPNIPVRTFSYWDASLPVLAATDINTDLNENFLKKYNAGLWAETGVIDDYYSQFLKLYKNEKLRKKMGLNGRKAIEEEFSVQKAVLRFFDQINRKNLSKAKE